MLKKAYLNKSNILVRIEICIYVVKKSEILVGQQPQQYPPNILHPWWVTMQFQFRKFVPTHRKLKDYPSLSTYSFKNFKHWITTTTSTLRSKLRVLKGEHLPWEVIESLQLLAKKEEKKRLKPYSCVQGHDTLIVLLKAGTYW